MRVYVAGPFTTIKGIRKVIEIQKALEGAGIQVLNQLEPFEWRKFYDFRQDPDLAKQIVEYDLSLVRKADLIVVLADKPSWGSGAEVFYAKALLEKLVIAIVTRPARSPWIVHHSDIVLEELDVEKLVEAIKKLHGRGLPPRSRQQQSPLRQRQRSR